jgi:hypothetical protein
MDRFSYSPASVKKVKAMQFGILDPDFMVRTVLVVGVSVGAQP